MIPETDGCEKSGGFNPKRGAKVIAFSREFLDKAAPLANGSHKDATGYSVQGRILLVTLVDSHQTTLADATQFTGYVGEPAAPSTILLINHGLHIEIQFDRTHTIGKTDTAGIKDVVLESAVTTIQDMEDSVSIVDASDKTLALGTLSHGGDTSCVALSRGERDATSDRNCQTIALVRLCHPANLPFVARGSGTSFFLAAHYRSQVVSSSR